MRPFSALPLLVLVACQSAEEDTVDLGDPVDPLVLPDVSDVDFATAYMDAIQLSKSVHAGRAWSGHVEALDRRFSDCPNLYAGPPDNDAIDAGDEGEGASWYDDCATPGGITYSGWAWWDATIQVDGDPTTVEGATVDATRTLDASGVVGAGGGGVGYEFKGEATDAISQVVAKDYLRWVWSSTVSGTLTGSDVFDSTSSTPGGWRTDLSFYATGGGESVYEPRGNIFLFDTLLHGRFDSIEMDLSFLGEGAVGPEDCALEPRGWIGLRDENAYWYDVVFLPRYADEAETTDNDPYTACDGCGTIYIRGVVAEEVGEICLDFSPVFAQDPLTPPGVEDYVLSLHTLQSEAP